MEYEVFKPGQRVINDIGEVLTVSRQDCCRVYVEEQLVWYHTSKLRTPFEGVENVYYSTP